MTPPAHPIPVEQPVEQPANHANQGMSEIEGMREMDTASFADHQAMGKK